MRILEVPGSKLALGITKCIFLSFVGKIGVSSGLSLFGLLKQKSETRCIINNKNKFCNSRGWKPEIKVPA